MSNNYSILQRNTLDGFSETAGCLYLKLLDVFQGHKSGDSERRAFLEACLYEDAGGGHVGKMLHNPIHNASGETISGLSLFFSERWRNNCMREGTGLAAVTDAILEICK